jgi:hypothetical protein
MRRTADTIFSCHSFGAGLQPHVCVTASTLAASRARRAS